MLTQPPHEILAKARNGKEASRRRTALGKREGASFLTYLGPGKTQQPRFGFHKAQFNSRREE